MHFDVGSQKALLPHLNTTPSKKNVVDATIGTTDHPGHGIKNIESV